MLWFHFEAAVTLPLNDPAIRVSLIDLEIAARLMTRDDRTMTWFLSNMGVLEAVHVQANGKYREYIVRNAATFHMHCVIGTHGGHTIIVRFEILQRTVTTYSNFWSLAVTRWNVISTVTPAVARHACSNTSWWKPRCTQHLHSIPFTWQRRGIYCVTNRLIPTQQTPHPYPHPSPSFHRPLSSNSSSCNCSRDSRQRALCPRNHLKVI